MIKLNRHNGEVYWEKIKVVKREEAISMFKLPMYVIFLIGAVVTPVLEKICGELKKRAQATPETWDDVAVGAFETVIEFLKQPGIFEPKK